MLLERFSFHVLHQSIYRKEKYICVIHYKGIFLLLGDKQTVVMERGKERKIFEGKNLTFLPQLCTRVKAEGTSVCESRALRKTLDKHPGKKHGSAEWLLLPTSTRWVACQLVLQFLLLTRGHPGGLFLNKSPAAYLQRHLLQWESKMEWKLWCKHNVDVGDFVEKARLSPVAICIPLVVAKLSISLHCGYGFVLGKSAYLEHLFFRNWGWFCYFYF